MELIKILLERWQGPMPKFFQIIFVVATAIAAIAFGADYFITDLQSMGIEPPVWFLKIASWAASAAAIVAKFTVDWKKKQTTEALNNFTQVAKPLSPPTPVRKPKWG